MQMVLVFAFDALLWYILVDKVTNYIINIEGWKLKLYMTTFLFIDSLIDSPITNIFYNILENSLNNNIWKKTDLIHNFLAWMSDIQNKKTNIGELNMNPFIFFNLSTTSIICIYKNVIPNKMSNDHVLLRIKQWKKDTKCQLNSS